MGKQRLIFSVKNIKHAALDYHDDMTGEIFMDWLRKKLLPNFPENSVIVMDNASYHSVQAEKISNSNSRKMEIMEFLEKNDLYYEENYTKKQLLEVLKTKHFEKRYEADTEAARAGYEVLRLPPYPIEMIWAQLKYNLRRNNKHPKFSERTIDLIKEELVKITPTNWANCERHVIEIEDSYRAKHVKDLIINLDDDDSDDGLCNSDCDHI
jgi:transposase